MYKFYVIFQQSTPYKIFWKCTCCSSLVWAYFIYHGTNQTWFMDMSGKTPYGFLLLANSTHKNSIYYRLCWTFKMRAMAMRPMWTIFPVGIRVNGHWFLWGLIKFDRGSVESRSVSQSKQLSYSHTSKRHHAVIWTTFKITFIIDINGCWYHGKIRNNSPIYDKCEIHSAIVLSQLWNRYKEDFNYDIQKCNGRAKTLADWVWQL